MKPELPALFRTLDCLSLPAPDLDTAVAFYAGLGHDVLWRTETAAGLQLPGSDAELVLQVERPYAEVDIVVASVDDHVVQFVAAGGRIVNGPFDIAIGRCVVVADPWDNVARTARPDQGSRGDGWRGSCDRSRAAIAAPSAS
jgi:predicted enzyme related to lactoylglutathione lyase